MYDENAYDRCGYYKYRRGSTPMPPLRGINESMPVSPIDYAAPVVGDAASPNNVKFGFESEATRRICAA